MGAGLVLGLGLGRGEHRVQAAVHPLAEVVPIGQVAAGDDPGHLGGGRGVELALGQLGTPHFLDKGPPKLGLQGGQHHVAAIGGAVQAVAGIAAAEPQAAGLGVLAAGRRRRQGKGPQAKQGIGHGHVHQAALAGALPLDKRRQDTHRRRQGPASQVGHL